MLFENPSWSAQNDGGDIAVNAIPEYALAIPENPFVVVVASSN